MIRKSVVSLLSIGVLASLAACGGSPEATKSPSVSEPAVEPSVTSETSAMTPSETTSEPSVPEPSETQSSEPAASEEPATTGEIPAAIQGKWITVSEGEEARECTEELDSEGAILTIDATKISSFAFYFELEELQETTANSMEGLFTYADDSDQLMTPMIRLETQDDWQTLEFIELGTEGQAPAIYSRCS